MAASEPDAPRRPEPGARPPLPASPPPRRRLSLGVRIALLLVGWLIVLVGVAGLFLPGLQGVVTLIAGAAILSVASDRVHRWLQQLLHRWPRLRRRLDRLRRRLHDRLAGR